MSNSSIFKNTLILYQQNQFSILQNKIYSSEEESRNCVLGDIVQDLDSGLRFNLAFKSGIIGYHANYNNEQGFSVVFKKHLNWFAHILETHFDKQNLIEAGCGVR